VTAPALPVIATEVDYHRHITACPTCKTVQPRYTVSRTTGELAHWRDRKAATLEADSHRCGCGSTDLLLIDKIDPAGPSLPDNRRVICAACRIRRNHRQPIPVAFRHAPPCPLCGRTGLPVIGRQRVRYACDDHVDFVLAHCVDKIGYRKQRTAEDAAVHARVFRWAAQVRHYPCRLCRNRWHIGGTPNMPADDPAAVPIPQRKRVVR
jgi:hypothetical protein